MASTQHIKQRISAVTNIGQITKAMELVAATRMRKSQEVALKSRPYAVAALELFHNIASDPLKWRSFSPFMAERPIKKTAVVVVTSDRGLAGSFNANVLRRLEESGWLNKEEAVFVTVGKKASEYITRKGKIVTKEFTGFGDYATPAETQELFNFLAESFLEAAVDQVVFISTHFRTTLRQEVLVRQLLPASVKEISRTVQEIVPEHGRYADKAGSAETVSGEYDYLIEPQPETVANALVSHLLSMQVYHTILEANASEHSARMVAMKSASDNAKSLKESLVLLFNKARQAAITQEIAEVTSGANALK